VEWSYHVDGLIYLELRPHPILSAECASGGWIMRFGAEAVRPHPILSAECASGDRIMRFALGSALNCPLGCGAVGGVGLGWITLEPLR
jgi:hypothetical protein